MRISQSVHTPAECNQIDSSNAELAVSLLDRRLLAGNDALFGQIRDPRPDLGRNIVQLTHERHAKFQGTIYHLEPNVKDSPGGLRDLQVLRWLSKLGAGDRGPSRRRARTYSRFAVFFTTSAAATTTNSASSGRMK